MGKCMAFEDCPNVSQFVLKRNGTPVSRFCSWCALLVFDALRPRAVTFGIWVDGHDTWTLEPGR